MPPSSGQGNVYMKNIYLFTPWSKVLLEKLTGFQLVKKSPAFYETRRFIAAVTSARHLSPSWASSIQSIHPHSTSWRSVLILSSHLCLGLPIGLFPSGFPTKTLYTPLLSPPKRYMHRPSPRFYHPNNIRWWAQIIKLPININNTAHPKCRYVTSQRCVTSLKPSTFNTAVSQISGSFLLHTLQCPWTSSVTLRVSQCTVRNVFCETVTRSGNL